MIKSRFRFHGGYIGTLFLAFFAIGGVIKLIINPYTTKGEPVGTIFILVLLLVWSVFLYSIYEILKIPKIIIDKQGLLFKTIFSTKRISWKEIATIHLTGKKNIAFTINAEEISTLNLITGEKVFIRVECYSNSSPIRQVLEKAISFLKKGKTELPVDFFEPIENEYIKQDYFQQDVLWASKFAGNPFLNLNAIIIIGFPIGLLLSLKEPITRYPERLPILLLPTIAFYLGFGFQLHYFILTEKNLVVKNHFLFWKKNTYKIGDIREIVFESPYRTSNSIRIITNTFQSKLYPAGSLRTKHWKELKKSLEEKHIVLRNEIGI